MYVGDGEGHSYENCCRILPADLKFSQAVGPAGSWGQGVCRKSRLQNIKTPKVGDLSTALAMGHLKYLMFNATKGPPLTLPLYRQTCFLACGLLSSEKPGRREGGYPVVVLYLAGTSHLTKGPLTKAEIWQRRRYREESSPGLTIYPL